jgi:hypothetical protein
MKKLIPILFLLLGCDKDSADKNSGEPSKVKATPACVAAGSNQSVRFTVELISDSTQVSKVQLVLSPSMMVFEINKPSTGIYTMYHHSSNCPNYNQSLYYYFLFTKKDGSKVATEPFHVYF